MASASRGRRSSARAPPGSGRPDELDKLGGLLTFDRPEQLYDAANATVWLPGQKKRRA
ncbi:MAG: hypothetical protein ACRDZ4_06390 [Egibacteraceae bacterium]